MNLYTSVSMLQLSDADKDIGNCTYRKLGTGGVWACLFLQSECEHPVDLRKELVGGAFQRREVRFKRVLALIVHVFEQQLTVPFDRIERIPQVVTNPLLKAFDRLVCRPSALDE